MAEGILAQNPNVDVIIKSEDLKTVYLNLEPLTSLSAQVSITDDKGQIVFEEWVRNTDTFERNYHLDELPNGQYFLIIEDELMVREQAILIEDEVLELDTRYWRNRYIETNSVTIGG